MRFIALLILIFFAGQSFANEVSLGMGMASVSYTENDTGESAAGVYTEVTAADVPASGSVSAMLVDLTYNVFEFPRSRIFVKTEVPLISSGGTGLFFGGGGFDYYIKSYATGSSTTYSGGEIEIAPAMRFYVGGFAGIDYLIYDTGYAEKSDTLFDLSVHSGIQYKAYKNIDISGEIAIGRGTGVATTTFNTRFFVGITYAP